MRIEEILLQREWSEDVLNIKIELGGSVILHKTIKNHAKIYSIKNL